MYLVYVKRMDAHLGGSILWKNQTGELALPRTAAWAYSSSVSSVKKEWKAGKNWGQKLIKKKINSEYKL